MSKSKPKPVKRGRPRKNAREKINENITIRLPIGGRDDVEKAASKLQVKQSEMLRDAVLDRVSKVLSGEFPGSQKDS